MKHPPWFPTQPSQASILRGEPPLRHTAPVVPLWPRRPNPPLAALSDDI